MKRGAVVAYAVAAVIGLVCLGVAVARQDWLAVGGWLAAAVALTSTVLHHRDAARLADEVDRVRSWLRYAREEREDARAQLRRASIRPVRATTTHDDLGGTA